MCQHIPTIPKQTLWDTLYRWGTSRPAQADRPVRPVPTDLSEHDFLAEHVRSHVYVLKLNNGSGQPPVC